MALMKQVILRRNMRMDFSNTTVSPGISGSRQLSRMVCQQITKSEMAFSIIAVEQAKNPVDLEAYNFAG